MLAKHEVDAVNEFIRLLLSVDMSSTHELVFGAISALKLADRRDSPSRRWFQSWWKNSGLRGIKTKSLAIVRYSTAQKQNVTN